MRHTLIGLFIMAVLLTYQTTRLCAQEGDQKTGLTAESQTTEGETLPLLTEKPLEIWTFMDDHRIIPGKTLHLTVQVIWELGIVVNFEGLDKIDLSPFRMEGVIQGKRQIFDNGHDFSVITFALSLPPDTKDGIYTIPSFTLSYKNEVEQTEGTASTSPIPIKKVPILVEGKINKDVITMGERVQYSLTIRNKENVEVLWKHIEEVDFSPFVILKKDLTKEKEGTIEKTVINFTLALFELGGKERNPEIPGVSVIYYIKPDSKNPNLSDTDSIVTREAKTYPISIMINSLLKAVESPLEGLKGPMLYSKKHRLLRAYLPIGFGALLLFALGISTIRSSLRKQATLVKKHEQVTPDIARERLKQVLLALSTSEDNNTQKENVHNINKALRTYVGILMGISNELAQSSPASKFLELDSQRQLPEEASDTIQTVLKQLDVLTFGRQKDKKELKKLELGIEEIVKLTTPNRQ